MLFSSHSNLPKIMRIFKIFSLIGLSAFLFTSCKEEPPPPPPPVVAPVEPAKPKVPSPTALSKKDKKNTGRFTNKSEFGLGGSTLKRDEKNGRGGKVMIQGSQ